MRVCDDLGTCVDVKIAIIRGQNATKDNFLEFTSETPFPASWLDGTSWASRRRG